MPDHTPAPVPAVSAPEPLTVAEILALIATPQQPAVQGRFDYSHDIAILALTMDGEGRGESILGRVAIAWTVKNRVIRDRADLDPTIRQACLRRAQYSCWWAFGGKENAERTLMMADAALRTSGLAHSGISTSEWAKFNESQYLAVGVIRGVLQDPTKGATHYITKALYATNPPTWARTAHISADIGNHFFFSGVR